MVLTQILLSRFVVALVLLSASVTESTEESRDLRTGGLITLGLPLLLGVLSLGFLGSGVLFGGILFNL